MYIVFECIHSYPWMLSSKALPSIYISLYLWDNHGHWSTLFTMILRLISSLSRQTQIPGAHNSELTFQKVFHNCSILATHFCNASSDNGMWNNHTGAVWITSHGHKNKTPQWYHDRGINLQNAKVAQWHGLKVIQTNPWKHFAQFF